MSNVVSIENAENTAKPRGRQPGVKVQSLDYRAFKALREVDFGQFGVSQSEKDEMIDVIIVALREKDIF